MIHVHFQRLNIIAFVISPAFIMFIENSECGGELVL
jgi:hypothetical protein